MDVRQLLVLFRKWFPLLLAGMVLASVAALGISLVQAKTYEARTTLIVGQALTSASPDYTGLLTSQSLTATYARVATARPQLEGAIRVLKLDTTPESLAKRVAAEATAGSTLIEISAQDTDPARAASIANQLASQLITSTTSLQQNQADFQASIDADLKATQEQIVTTQQRVTELLNLATRTDAEETELTTLEARLITLRSTYATLLGYSTAGAPNLLSVVEPAVAPAEAISPKIPLNVLVAAVVGLLLAAGLAFLLEYLDESVDTPEDVRRLTGSTLLASIGHMKALDSRRELYQLASILHPRSPVSEAYRSLRASLEFAAVDSGLRSVVVTSAQPGEGKTVTASNLAIVFAQAGRRVLLVDADLRKPSLHEAFGLRNDIGLTTVLVVSKVGAEGLAQATAQPNLSVLTSGPQPPNPAELLSSERMRALLERAAQSYELVILDSPPVGPFADAAVLAKVAGASVLVVDAEEGKRRSVTQAREALARVGAHLLGVVHNRAPGAPSELAGGYGGTARPGRGEPSEPTTAPASARLMTAPATARDTAVGGALDVPFPRPPSPPDRAAQGYPPAAAGPAGPEARPPSSGGGARPEAVARPETLARAEAGARPGSAAPARPESAAPDPAALSPAAAPQPAAAPHPAGAAETSGAPAAPGAVPPVVLERFRAASLRAATLDPYSLGTSPAERSPAPGSPAAPTAHAATAVLAPEPPAPDAATVADTGAPTTPAAPVEAPDGTGSSGTVSDEPAAWRAGADGTATPTPGDDSVDGHRQPPRRRRRGAGAG